MKYKPEIVLAYWRTVGIPEPVAEYRFHPDRRWRFDWAWPRWWTYLEVDGGIWIRGGHNRGAQMKADWEKRNAATVLGWRGVWCEPRDLCMEATAQTIKAALVTGGWDCAAGCKHTGE